MSTCKNISIQKVISLVIVTTYSDNYCNVETKKCSKCFSSITAICMLYHSSASQAYLKTGSWHNWTINTLSKLKTGINCNLYYFLISSMTDLERNRYQKLTLTCKNGVTSLSLTQHLPLFLNGYLHIWLPDYLYHRNYITLMQVVDWRKIISYL